ncbi:hypothetical protein HAZT_HAZT009609 [Hyalella azteca]|uniref:Probable arginine--tRNA ligase, mitochondrial n=1 Tax=Hyalella azteca TaxID=294128 RepID=A0A6A0H8E6_HYAAZ|nr:hypothetical protein HAZT_HAZT009609 [Hyalella azteca]
MVQRGISGMKIGSSVPELRKLTDHLITFLKVNPKVATLQAPCNNTSAQGCFRFDVSLKKLNYALISNPPCESHQRSKVCELQDLGSSLVHKIETDDTLLSAYVHPHPNDDDMLLSLTVPAGEPCCEVLQNVLKQPSNFWHQSDLLSLIPKQSVVVEFSSPNIAKPFHVGHLRSTILGGCLSRMHAALGHHVIRLNYLGDWGTQFGLLKYGCDARSITRSDLLEDPIKKLYEVYVWANKQAETDPNVHAEASQLFSRMEHGDEQALEQWRFFRDISVKDLNKTYKRLGISFDEYHGESDYPAASCAAILRQMEDCGLLELHEDGRKMYEFTPGRKVTVVKSDGSSIYLSRDIAAAVDRYQKFGFDHHYYVVDMTQIDHFRALFSALTALQYPWARRMRHVRFGRIKGLSSRKGSTLFLSDLLDDGRKLMMKQQTQTSTTLVSGNDAVAAADALALSAIVVADLRQRRHRDYDFSWQAALRSTGDTGVRLQYTHCRLVQLEQNCGVALNLDAQLQSLASEPAALACVALIAKYEEILYEFHESLEPYILVSYLFKLSHSINKALYKLKVRDAPRDVAEARLALFVAARHTLAAGLTLLGLQPLDKM